MAEKKQRRSSSKLWEDMPMAETLWANNPFVKMFSEINAPWCNALKQGAAQYIETTEKWAQRALEMNEKATAWAKDTPFAPLFETQQLIARQSVELSTEFARRLWQLEDKVEEKVAEVVGVQH
jgi:hypothetical protein